MAYDERLAQLLRDALAGQAGAGKTACSFSEKKMMGGLCLMLDGNMVGGVDRSKAGEDRFMFRVGKDNHAAALKKKGARAMEIGGKQLGGFVFVDAKGCKDKVLEDWVALALAFVRTLPPK